MFTKLQLKNFKVWVDTGEINLKPVTMLLGTNSSGKSSIIQSLLLLKQTMQSPDRTIHLNFGGDEVNDLFNFGEFDSVLREGASPRRFEMSFSFKRPSIERVSMGDYGCSYGSTSSRAVAIQELVLKAEQTTFKSLRKSKGSYSLMVNDESQPRGNGRNYAPERSIGLSPDALSSLHSERALFEDLSLGIRREFEGIIYLGPLRRKPERDYVWNRSTPGEVGSDGHKTVDVLLASALIKDEERGGIIAGVSKWLKKMGVADEIVVKQIGRSNRYEVVILRNGIESNLRDVGIGVSQVLPVLTVAYFAPEGSTVILEEPEIHLHPLAQSVLAELFVEISKERKIQFLVETHSEHVFRRMQTLIAEEKVETDQCSMFFVERNKSESILTELNIGSFGEVKNWPDNFFGDSVGEARKQALARVNR